MRTRNFLKPAHFSPGMKSAWKWVCAIDAFDYNHVEPLAELVKAEPVPEELRPIIAEIVAGNRRPNKRAAAKLKIPAEERMQIAGTVSAVLGLIDTIKFDAIDSTDPYLAGRSGVTMLSDCPTRGKNRSPEEIMRELEGDAREAMELAARELGLKSTEAVENLLRDLRAKMKAYPDI